MASAQCEICSRPEKTVNDCYSQVIQKLTDQGKIKEISSHLMKLKTDHERVLYVYRVVNELSLLPAVKVNKKNDLVSLHYRNLGNTHFKHKRYYEAYQAYNLSLLYAETTSENFTYAISNRSAVFFSMKKYKECLEDIKFVFNSTFPEKIKKKLVDRREKCYKKLVEDELPHPRDEYYSHKITQLLLLEGKANQKYPCASSKLRVAYTEEMGRHVIANEDIKVGEILAVENAYLTVLLEPQFLFCCAHCLSRTMNLYPCMVCVYTLYCSVDCRETARNKYHSVECGLLASIIGMGFTKMDLLALRAVLRSRSDVGSWEEAIHVANIADSRINTDIWGCVKEGDKWIYDSKYYSSIHTLATNVEKRSLSDIFRKCLEAAFLTTFLSSIRFLTDNKHDLMYHEINKYVAGTIFRHIMTSPTNMHSISTNIAGEDGKFVEEYQIASGAYAFLSLLNHSCAPNVVRYSLLGSSQMSLIAIRPIKKGMQIFDNYGYHYAVQDRNLRQSSLRFQYKFTCSCEACVNDWPMHKHLKEAKGVPTKIIRLKEECLSSEVIEKLMRGDKKTAVDYFQPLCDLVRFFDAHAPCKELSECQEAMKQCLAIFHGVVPYEYTKIVKFKAYPPCHATGGPPHVVAYIPAPSLF